ncbi:MAG: hypothetical protein KY475_27115, partial [Planctomycetes bacterium]|nr:hypothetical protein [Planctomycetota bacterium]
MASQLQRGERSKDDVRAWALSTKLDLGKLAPLAEALPDDWAKIVARQVGFLKSAPPSATPEYAWSVSSGGHATLTVKGSKGGSNTTTMSVASWRGFLAYT